MSRDSLGLHFAVTSWRSKLALFCLFFLSRIRVSSKHCSEKALGEALICLSGLVFCHYATAKHVCAEKKHTRTLLEEENLRSKDDVMFSAGIITGRTNLLNTEELTLTQFLTMNLRVQSILNQTNSHTLHGWNPGLNIISNADSLRCVSFPLVSILPVHVYSKASVNATRNILSFMGLCWSHTAFPCIIYIRLSPSSMHSQAQVTNKQGSMNDRNQIFMSEPEHLRQVTWPPGSAEMTSCHTRPPEGSKISSIRKNLQQGG